MEDKLHRFLHDLTDGNPAHATSIMTTALRYIPQSNFEVRPNPYRFFCHEHTNHGRGYSNLACGWRYEYAL